MADKMILVDGNSLMYRAFFAVKLMNNDEGIYTNALHVFLSMLLNAFEAEKPRYCAVAFDMHGPTFRHAKYDQYKAGRSPTPDELIPQMEWIRTILAEMHIPILELPGYEADDLLGTASLQCEQKGIDTVIITGDRDSFQLAGEHVQILYTRRGVRDTERVTPEYIRGTWGVEPIRMIDIKGLMGDSSDNIPGVPGVGEKTAQKLIAQYGSLEAVLESADTQQKGALRERLITYRDQALFSKWLATIDRSAPCALDFEVCEIRDLTDARSVLRKLQLRQAEEKLVKLAGVVAAKNPMPEPAAPAPAPDTASSLRAMAKGARPEWTSVYLGDCLWVVTSDGLNARLALGGDLIEQGASEREAVAALEPLFASGCRVITHDAKRLMNLGAASTGEVFDVMLAGYVLNPQARSLALVALAAGQNVPLNERSPAEALAPLYGAQLAQLTINQMLPLFTDVEMPLTRVLYDMERAGFAIDEGALERLGDTYAEQIDRLSAGIREYAGAPINVNSPKQLGELLFDRLGLLPGRKTSTGRSTSAEVLEQLRDEHPVVGLILDYRKYAKLKSTYIDALIRMRGTDGRVHTSFDQVSTATGRISSQEPNLQNIPVRSELGRDIRRAFVARPGFRLVDADYSQIELRVLAHMSGDEVMREAFLKDQDIHARTAAEVEGVPLEAVTPAMRSAAKAVNFGIVYGISDFGLARNIGVSRQRAAEFIDRYFARYPLVKRFMDECVEKGKSQGYVETLMGRRRYLPELRRENDYNTRKFGERAAMNSPIQGSAADIIKMAMVRVHRELTEGGLSARLILQVHDELIVEAPDEEVGSVRELIRRAMEGVMKLTVPLKVDVSDGQSWYDCK